MCMYNRMSSLLRSDCFATLWTVAHQASLSMGVPRQEHWSGLLFISPKDIPNPGIRPTSPVLQVNSLLPSHWGSPYNEMLLSHKKKIKFTATWMQLEIIILSEVSQKKKDKYPRRGTNEPIYKNRNWLTNLENRLVVARWDAIGRGLDWGFGVGASVHAKSLQLCPTLWDHINCSPPGPSLHGIGVGRCKLVH